MIPQDFLLKLKEIALSCLQKHSLDLIDIKCAGYTRPTLTIFIDRPEGGITIEECAIMNRQISEEFDASGILATSYILEVCSPGVDRLLKNKNDFSRVINKTVRCYLAQAIGNSKEIEGRVQEVNEECVVFDTEGGFTNVPYGNMIKAQQKIN